MCPHSCPTLYLGCARQPTGIPTAQLAPHARQQFVPPAHRNERGGALCSAELGAKGRASIREQLHPCPAEASSGGWRAALAHAGRALQYGVVEQAVAHPLTHTVGSRWNRLLYNYIDRRTGKYNNSRRPRRTHKRQKDCCTVSNPQPPCYSSSPSC